MLSNNRNAGSLIITGLLNIFVGVLLVTLVITAWMRFTNRPLLLKVFKDTNQLNITEQPANQSQVNENLVGMPVEGPETTQTQNGIIRKPSLITTIPERSPVEIITHTVQTGDTLFDIADLFKIKPTTLLWGNFDVLQDNPHLLKPGQVLNILPVDGTYYEWQKGDTLAKIADQFGVEVDNITSFTGNNIDLTRLNEHDSGILPETRIIVPGGQRAIKDWGPPAISRSNPASARNYGPGACATVTEGAVGTGSFLWPSTDRSISGYGYDPGVHPAIDIGGQVGNAIFASDSGVVVYAGWSDYGYGYLIVIDHEFGWQSAYAHLSAVGVSCGQSVFRGQLIGALGASGNATGPHLHFELVYNGAKINPMDFLQ